VPPERSPLAEVFAGLDDALRRLGLRWYLFGAQAALLYGAARLTADVDVTLEVTDLPLTEVLDALIRGGFDARVSDAAGFARRTRVLPVAHRSTGIPVDVVLAGPGLEPLFLSRAEQRDIEGVQIRVARAEDVVTMKILAGRPKDIEDAVAVLAAGGDDLNLGMIRETLGAIEDALSQRDLLLRLDAALSRSRRGRSSLRGKQKKK
jgi:hypothetical protein